MATYSAYTKTSSSSTSSSTLISSSSKTYMNKALINHHHNHHQYIQPTTRYIKNTLPISYQHNSLKTTSNITRCKPMPNRHYTPTSAINDSNRLERNYSYIEAMKETKSLPSSSNSSSTSTIESPINDTTNLQPQIEEVEIPIEIKLIENNNSNLAKSRSQSSIFNLFRNTFSPFQIRKWRSKSRDKLLYDSNNVNHTTLESQTKEPVIKQTYTQSYTKKPSPQKEYNSKDFVLPIRRETVDISRLDIDNKKENNFSYTSSMSSNSNSSDSSNSSYSKLSPKLSPTASARQLSYLKLTCLLNGYDNSELKADKSDSGSVKSIYLKSSKAMLNNTERYYDVRPNFRKYTSSSREIKKTDDIDGQIYKTELSVRLNLNEQNKHKSDDFADLANIIEPIKVTDDEIKEPEAIKQDEIVNQTIVDNIEIKHDDETKISSDNVNNKNDNSNKQIVECDVNVENVENAQAQQQVVHDGHYFLNLLDKSTQRINELCSDYQTYVDETSDKYIQNEEVQGRIQTAIGKGQLLINQKFKQFRGLCDKNIKEKNDSNPLKEGEFVTRDDDLAGFWDMVYLQVEDIERMFEELAELKKNDWVIKQVIKTAAKKKLTPGAKKEDTAASKARAEAARQRIQEMKKKAALAKSQNQYQEKELISN